ncbi:MAG: hypothetical protein DRO99_01380 [Candidatus Aenigmatarchaeota archaeon]|nr:MAG: hypothetical protein DRO99_01380 [Candidatus Aenigmarchaeota archaeon]
MLEWVLLLIGIIGFGAAGYWDLKTTEFPDWLPYSIIISALGIRGLFAFLAADPSLFIDSVIVGLAFLGMGLGMYYTKQWGDGDAWLLGGLGFLFPTATGFRALLGAHVFPFPVMLLFNFFLLSFMYLIAYSIVLGFMKPGLGRKFFAYLKGNSRVLGLSIIGFTILCICMAACLNMQLGIQAGQLAHLFLFPAFFALVVIFMYYGKFIEDKVFRKRIDVKDLRAGDVPVGMKWETMSENDIKKLKRKGGKIWIKEGVRFAPVFVITMLVTLFIGNLMSLFL